MLAAVLTYPERAWPDFHGTFVNDHPVLATVCDDGDRRGDRAPVLVAHSTRGFARPRLADPASAAGDLEAAVRDLLGVPKADRDAGAPLDLRPAGRRCGGDRSTGGRRLSGRGRVRQAAGADRLAVRPGGGPRHPGGRRSGQSTER